MRIDLNSIVMDVQGTDVVLNPPIRGLTVPPIRTASGNFSGRDGGWVSSQFYAVREIVLNGTVRGDDCPDAAEKICRLQEAIGIRQKLPMYVTVSEGTTYFTEVYLADFNLDIDNERIHRFQMTLLAPDPNFYISDPDDPNAGWVDQTIFRLVGGGYITPYILPVEWEPGSTPTIITNGSSMPAYPQIILEDEWTNPRIVNNTTGAYVELNVTTTSGDKIVIDMYNRTVTLNGGSILPSREAGSSWWALVSGNNSISLSSDSNDDGTEGIIRYRIPYGGIYGGIC